MGHTQPRKAIHPGEDLSFPVYMLKGHILDPRTWTPLGFYPFRDGRAASELVFAEGESQTGGKRQHWQIEEKLADQIFVIRCQLCAVEQCFLRTRVHCHSAPPGKRKINFKLYHLLLQQLVPRFTNRAVHHAFASSGQIKGE